MNDRPSNPPTSEGVGRAKALFLDALELEGDTQREFLARLEAEAPEDCARVRELLRAHLGASWVDQVPTLANCVRSGSQDSEHEAGTVVGNYELLEEVAAGASGVVWRARQRSLGRVVALKLLRAGRCAGERELARFRNEAEAVAQLDHPHIVPVYEIGEHEGHAYFSMKWIEGGSLDSAIGGGWEPRRAAQLVATVARAVHHAHQRGILHRDLKPSNVLLDEEGEPHVADFGVSKRIDAEETQSPTRGLVGTPAYMAPEQARSKGELTMATDVWALGCILHEVVAGQPAFQGDSFTDLLLKIRDGEPSRLRAVRSDAPRDLETIVLKCLNQDPTRRYASAQALAEDLERWLTHEPILARRATPVERALLAWRRSPVIVGLGAAVALLILALAVGASWSSLALRSRLRDSWLEHARATRLSGVPGRRAEALALLARAAAVRPDRALRDEAIACLALTDVSLEQSWPRPTEDGFTHAMSGDLERWAWFGADGAIHVERVADRALLQRLESPDDPERMRLSADGRFLAVKNFVAEGETLAPFRVWDIDRGVAVVDTDTRLGFLAFDVDPRGRFAAHVTLQAELVLHDLGTGEETLRVDIGARAGAVRFSSDGLQLAIGVGGDLRELQVRDVSAGELLHSIPLPGSPWMVDWGDGGKTVGVACSDYNAYIWDVGEDAFRVGLEGHQAEVTRIDVSPDARFAATYAWDGTTRVWDAQTGAEVLRMPAYLARVSDDGRRIVVSSNEGLSIWRLEHGQVLRRLRGHETKSPRGLAFSPDLRRLVTVGPDGAFSWDIESGRRLNRLSNEAVAEAIFLPGDEGLLLGGRMGIERRRPPSWLEGESLLDVPLTYLALSADARVAAGVGLDQVHFLNLEDRSRDVSIQRPAGMTSVIVAPDGAWVSGQSWRGPGVHVWDAATGEELQFLLPEFEDVHAALSPAGDLFVTSSRDSHVVWRTDTWERTVEIPRRSTFDAGGNPVAFHPDGRRFAAIDLPGRVTFYDAVDGSRLSTLEPPTIQPASRIGFAKDGSYLGVAFISNVAHVWDLQELERQLAALRLGEP